MPNSMKIRNLARHPGVLATLSAFAFFAVIASLLSLQFDQSERVTFRQLRERVGNLAVAAAVMIDGDLHQKVVESGDRDGAAYRAAVAPLVRFHNALPQLFYVYSMIQRDGRAYYMLDTAGQPGLHTTHKLIPSLPFEPFDGDNSDGWLDILASGRVYVNPDLETDIYGTFLSGHAPFYGSDGSIKGFSGVDVDAGYVVHEMHRLKNLFRVALEAGFGLAVLFGAGFYRFLDIKRAETERLAKDSLTDKLTGVWNRRAYELRIDGDFKRFKRSGVHCTVLMIDADHFKQINDRHGHDVGDLALKHIVRLIQRELRDADFVGRWGGEEFSAVLFDTRIGVGTKIADRLREVIASTPLTLADGEEVPITISIGVAEFQSDDTAPANVIARADRALYQAKREGRNRVISSCGNVLEPTTIVSQSMEYLNMSGNSSESRRNRRVPFAGRVRLQNAEGAWEADLVDISLKGLAVAEPENEARLPIGTRLSALFRLAPSVEIRMEVCVAWFAGGRIGFEWTEIDTDSLTHLRRLMEFNLGDAEEVRAGLATLTKNAA